MKASLLILAAALALAPVLAQEAAKKTTPAEQLLEVTRFQASGIEAALAAFQPAIAQFKAQGYPPEAIEEIEAAAEAYFHQVMSDPDLRKGVLALYNEVFTEDELEEMLAFYETPTGQKALVQMPKILGDAMTLGQKHAEKYAPGFQAQLEKILARHKKADDATPPPGKDKK